MWRDESEIILVEEETVTRDCKLMRTRIIFELFLKLTSVPLRIPVMVIKHQNMFKMIYQQQVVMSMLPFLSDLKEQQVSIIM